MIGVARHFLVLLLHNPNFKANKLMIRDFAICLGGQLCCNPNPSGIPAATNPLAKPQALLIKLCLYPMVVMTLLACSAKEHAL